MESLTEDPKSKGGLNISLDFRLFKTSLQISFRGENKICFPFNLELETRTKFEIRKEQEARGRRQDAFINDLQSKNEAVTKDMSALAEIMETKYNKTEEALKAIGEAKILSAPGGKAVKDLPYIMICTYQDNWRTAGVNPYMTNSLRITPIVTDQVEAVQQSL